MQNLGEEGKKKKEKEMAQRRRGRNKRKYVTSPIYDISRRSVTNIFKKMHIFSFWAFTIGRHM